VKTSGLRRALPIVYVLVVLGASAPAQTKQEEFVRWASERAIPLSTADAGGDFTDMLPLKAVVGSARIVASSTPPDVSKTDSVVRATVLRRIP
jgi:hypothetical protein